jgi:hypothetical protein
VHNYGASPHVVNIEGTDHDISPLVEHEVKRALRVRSGRDGGYNININGGTTAHDSAQQAPQATYIPEASGYDNMPMPRKRVSLFESFISHLTGGKTPAEAMQSIGKAVMYIAVSLMVLGMLGALPMLGFLVTSLFSVSAPLTACFAIGAVGLGASKVAQAYSDAKNDMKDQKAYEQAVAAYHNKPISQPPIAPTIPYPHRDHGISR